MLKISFEGLSGATTRPCQDSPYTLNPKTPTRATQSWSPTHTMQAGVTNAYGEFCKNCHYRTDIMCYSMATHSSISMCNWRCEKPTRLFNTNAQSTCKSPSTNELRAKPSSLVNFM